MILNKKETSELKDQFTEKIFQHQALIHKICHMYRDSREDREDLFQEIIYQLWKSYPTFSGRSKLSTWIYRIALNTALASFRKNSVKLHYTEAVPDTRTPYVFESSNPREELLFAAIRQLEEDERAVIALYLEDMNYKEIAEVLGISENNVGVRLNRIKKKLRTLITEKDGIRRS